MHTYATKFTKIVQCVNSEIALGNTDDILNVITEYTCMLLTCELCNVQLTVNSGGCVDGRRTETNIGLYSSRRHSRNEGRVYCKHSQQYI